MKIYNALIFLLLTFSLDAQGLSSQDYSVETHLKVIDLDKVSPPEPWNGKIIFTYSVPSVPLKTVTIPAKGLNLEKNYWTLELYRLKPNQKVKFSPLKNGKVNVLPLPLDPQKIYYVNLLSDSTFQIAGVPRGKPLVFLQVPKEDFNLEILEDANPRSVSLAFAFEGYAQRHLFSRNAKDIYFYVFDPLEYPALAQGNSLDYRFIVDGLWTVDPTNSEKYRDDRGILISTVSLPQKRGVLIDSPLIQGNGEVEFVFRAESGKRISVVGNFNNWDPFMHPLAEDPRQAGIYKLKLRLPAGPVYYSFMVGAERVKDPLNPRVATYDDGESCSWFQNVRQDPPLFRGS